MAANGKNKAEQELEAVRARLLEEAQLWEEAQISPDQFNTQTDLNFMCRIEAMEDAIKELCGNTDVEWEVRVTEAKLKILQTLREATFPQIMQARAQARIAVPMPKLLGPNGKPVM